MLQTKELEPCIYWAPTTDSALSWDSYALLNMTENQKIGSVSWASDSWFRLRSWFQGHGIKPHIGLHTEHGFSLSLSLSLSPSAPHPHSCSLSLKEKRKKFLKRNKISWTRQFITFHQYKLNTIHQSSPQKPLFLRPQLSLIKKAKRIDQVGSSEQALGLLLPVAAFCSNQALHLLTRLHLLD